jgi:ankyrin repeat protein
MIERNDRRMIMTVFEAVERNDLEALKELIACGSDVNEQDPEKGTALEFACRIKAPNEIVRQLLNAGARVTYDDGRPVSALKSAIKNEDFDNAVDLVAAGVPMSDEDKIHYVDAFVLPMKDAEDKMKAEPPAGTPSETDGPTTETLVAAVKDRNLELVKKIIAAWNAAWGSAGPSIFQKNPIHLDFSIALIAACRNPPPENQPQVWSNMLLHEIYDDTLDAQIVHELLVTGQTCITDTIAGIDINGSSEWKSLLITEDDTFDEDLRYMDVSAVTFACRTGLGKVLQECIACAPDFPEDYEDYNDSDLNSLLFNCITSYNLPGVQVLLKAGVPVSDDDIQAVKALDMTGATVRGVIINSEGYSEDQNYRSPYDTTLSIDIINGIKRALREAGTEAFS